MKSQDRFKLCATIDFSEKVELLTKFYVTDSQQVSDSSGDKTNIMEDPLSYRSDLQGFELGHEDFLALIKEQGYRLANWREIELLKRFLVLDPRAKDRILIYQDQEEGLNGVHPYRPFKDFFSFEDKTFLRRFFEDFYPIDNEDKIVLVCVRL